MKLDDFNYHLPKDYIAQTPYLPRDRCRLLVLHKNGDIEHKIFRDILDYLQKNDTLVINTTKVIPARLIGSKKETGGKVEIFLIKKIAGSTWECMFKPFRKVKPGTEIIFPNSSLTAKVIQKEQTSRGLVDFKDTTFLEDNLFKTGQVPLPPYIKRKDGPTDKDEKAYQTVYAQEPGAIAAPTAGLHFTSELLNKIKQKGVEIIELTLHTGCSSFFPLKAECIEKNELPAEYFKISPYAAKKVNECRMRGGRVVAVGTTTVRALETNYMQNELLPGAGWANLFIYPGYEFKIVDALITNFHMPRSSLLILVSAFLERENLLAAYREALSKGYRFLSFGDAMLII